jgi:hypothetical protein
LFAGALTGVTKMASWTLYVLSKDM